MQSSASEFVSMYVAGQKHGDAADTMRASRLVQAGAFTYGGNRGGDYSGIAVDPANDSFWAANEVVVRNDPGANWSTWIANFSLANEPLAVYFDTGLFNLDPTDTAILDDFSARLQADPTLVATIEGHTDTVGTTASNQTLSQNRANAVYNYLTTHGIAPARLTRAAFGELELVDDTGDSDQTTGTDSQANRRVVLTVDRVVYTGSVNAFNDPVSGGTYKIPAQPDRGIWMGLSADVDRSSSAHRGRIYVAFADQGTSHDDTDIFVIFSDDHGARWSSRVRVNDDAANASQFFSWLDVDQSTGNVALSWYDTRNDVATGNDDVQYFMVYSKDGGVTWSRNLQVSDGSSNAHAAGGFNLGDYTGLAYVDGVIHMVWSDNSNSTSDNVDGTRHAMDTYYDRFAPATYLGIEAHLEDARLLGVDGLGLWVTGTVKLNKATGAEVFAGWGGSLLAGHGGLDTAAITANGTGFFVNGASFKMVLATGAEDDPVVANRGDTYLGIEAGLTDARLIGVQGLELWATGTVKLNKATDKTGTALTTRMDSTQATGVANDPDGLLADLHILSAVELQVTGSAAINASFSAGVVAYTGDVTLTFATVTVDGGTVRMPDADVLSINVNDAAVFVGAGGRLRPGHDGLDLAEINANGVGFLASGVDFRMVLARGAAVDKDVNVIATPTLHGSQSEVAIAVNPADPNNIVVAPVDMNPTDGISGAPSFDSVWVSTNAGRTFERKRIPLPVGAAGSNGDPTLVLSRDGSLLVYAHMVNKPGGGAVMSTALSRDGGLTWDAADVRVMGSLDQDEDGDTFPDDSDKEFLAVGPDVADHNADRFVL